MRAPDAIAVLFEAGNVGWTMFGIALALLLLAVTVLARLRWIQSRPLAACVVLSVAAHGLLISAVQLTRMFDVTQPPGDAGIAVRLSEELAPPQPMAKSDPKGDADRKKTLPDKTVLPWEKLATEPSPRPTMTPLPAVEPAVESDSPPPPASLLEMEPVLAPDPPPSLPPAPLPYAAIDTAIDTAKEEWRPLTALDDPPLPEPAAAIPSPVEQRKSPAPESQHIKEAADSASKPDRLQWQHSQSDSPDETLIPSRPRRSQPKKSKPTTKADERPDVPRRYQARMAVNRQDVAQRRGGNAETEAAVRRALAWLVANQAADGRWDASDHGAGQGQLVEGRFRGAAGIRADTGITGLALLALLGAGHTHEQGAYEEATSRGLTYLLRQQAADGNLAGNATNFARMYCHGIASLAVCECLAMTNDERLRPYARQAVRYTLQSQHPATGGWRYHPGDPGDTSQFGWQVMVLTAADEAGLHVPLRTRQGMRKFLGNACSGEHRGLASYRVGQPATRSMTAEALACRAFLGENDARATSEASRFLIGERPGSGTDDLYYWYYATLGLHLFDTEDWPQWNSALTRTLLATQESGGWQSGSWSPTSKWAGHGGRVYSTALSTMCLEVYYRYAN